MFKLYSSLRVLFSFSFFVSFMMLLTNDHMLSCLTGGSASVACAVTFVDFDVAYFLK